MTVTDERRFHDGQRLLLREVPVAECANCGKQVRSWEESRWARVILDAMEQNGPDVSSYEDPRWDPLIASKRREAEEESRRSSKEAQAAEGKPLEHFLAEKPGKWPNPYPKMCMECGRQAERSVRHDSMFCPECDIWLEEPCGRQQCLFCTDRPDRSSHADEGAPFTVEIGGSEAARETDPPWLGDLSWTVMWELIGGLREEGERQRAHEVPFLRVWDICRCGEPGACASFSTQPRLRGLRPPVRCISLHALDGLVLVDVGWGEADMRFVEILFRPALRDEVRTGWDARAPHDIGPTESLGPALR